MTTQKQALKESIAASINVIKELDAGAPTEPATISVMHLGHPSDAQFGQVEHMTESEYRRFVWLHTWPRPKGAQA
jgi:hypothetical protein